MPANGRAMTTRPPTLDDRIAATRLPADQPVVMHQQWKQLLFLHWEVPPEAIQRTLPAGLTVDTFGGRAFLGIVPFYMRGIRPRFCPPLSGISDFLELNLRTYVHDEERLPGVWFYSLDASQWLAVRTARKLFHLPYFDASMYAEERGSPPMVDYTCQRRHASEEPARFVYSGDEPLPPPQPGSLEYFLVERYVLFSHHRASGRLFAGRVHHAPYPLETARVERFSEIPIVQSGFPAFGRSPDLAHFSRGVEVTVYPLRPLPSPSNGS